MVLSDYDTAAEKIAALRCAFIDPALINYHAYGTTFNVVESIYFVSTSGSMVKLGSLYLPWNAWGYGVLAMESFGLPIRINSGKSFDIQSAGNSMAYIKDSDITYSDPVTTYQNRLGILYESETIISGDFTVGEYGALLTFSDTDTNGKLNINGSILFDDNAVIMFPVKKDDVITYSGQNGSHIDLPSNW